MLPNYSYYMDNFLDGKRALVTGGSRGIGYAIAEQLLEAGASVVICGRSVESAQSAARTLAAKGTVHATKADVSKPEDVQALVKFAQQQLGGIDILVNNAGVGVFRSVAELEPEQWRSVINTNLTGVFDLCHAVLPGMRAQGGGFIVNIGSLAGKNAFAGGAAYNASKFGLLGFSEAMMLDHRNENVRVTTVMPGSVDTEFNSGSKGASWKIAPEDIAEIVLDILRLPARTLVSRVEVRPSKPKQS